MAELMEDQHEDYSQAIAHDKLHHQQRRAYVFIEVWLEVVPQYHEGHILHEAQGVVDGQASPARLFLHQVVVSQVQLHGGPAENIDAGVEKCDHAEHHGGAKFTEVLLYVLRQWCLPGPELNPWLEEEDEQVGQAHQDHPERECCAEEHQGGDPCSDL